MDYETQEKRPATKEERSAKKEKARQEAEKVLAELKKEDDAFRANFERLKAERLARETKS
ncbi:hypothetical protein [Bradyrhizobium sp. AUGA SZCCT0182]|uniref:hypothetical protein n=1 Tax=Bradyrhizobium sp. AUGA SZCCT0182 TaxID=2807667 RepID=UPI001BAB14F3|nr:hypothetical protein [Bradyrhizobium sp. AUGA SZCCT0182]MBR1234613.1 hypothetical protein [Bradyrhizobium sp. AUGA SZCCT0182]